MQKFLQISYFQKCKFPTPTSSSSMIPRLYSSSSQQATTTTSSKATTTTTTTTTTNEQIPIPTSTQLKNHYIANTLPMIGFGIMDQTVLIQAGNMIDLTIGVQFGLSTLTAAAIGGLISNVSGILFGGTLETIAKTLGLVPASNLTPQQRSLSFVRRGRIVSQVLGIVLGCCIGMVNLLFIDTDKSQSLKLLNKTEEEEFAFDVEISNNVRDDATVLTVKGPDLDGILASVTAALTLNGCSLLEVEAHSNNNASTTSSTSTSDVDGSHNEHFIEDTFVIVDQETKGKLKDEDLEELCKIILNASREGPNLLKYKVKELEDKNHALQARIDTLEGVLLKRRLSVVKSSGKGIVRD